MTSRAFLSIAFVEVAPESESGETPRRQRVNTILVLPRSDTCYRALVRPRSTLR